MAHAEETVDQGRRGSTRHGAGARDSTGGDRGDRAVEPRRWAEGVDHDPGEDQDPVGDGNGSGRTGSITRGGAPSGKCPADSAQGALNVATHGNWAGKWYSSYDEYFITGILGDSETTKKYYWGVYVNGKVASKGACEIKLKSGDKLLFKVTKS